MVPTWAGLGQFNRVNGRHLPSHQEGELGSFRGREGRGEVKKTGGGRSLLLLCLQLLCTRDPLPLPTEPLPLPIYGFFSAKEWTRRSLGIKPSARCHLGLAQLQPLLGHKRRFLDPGIVAGLHLLPSYHRTLHCFVGSKHGDARLSFHTCQHTYI